MKCRLSNQSLDTCPYTQIKDTCNIENSAIQIHLIILAYPPFIVFQRGLEHKKFSVTWPLLGEARVSVRGRRLTSFWDETETGLLTRVVQFTIITLKIYGSSPSSQPEHPWGSLGSRLHGSHICVWNIAPSVISSRAYWRGRLGFWVWNRKFLTRSYSSGVLLSLSQLCCLNVALCSLILVVCTKSFTCNLLSVVRTSTSKWKIHLTNA